jgi:hypothetical protein
MIIINALIIVEVIEAPLMQRVVAFLSLSYSAFSAVSNI